MKARLVWAKQEKTRKDLVRVVSSDKACHYNDVIHKELVTVPGKFSLVSAPSDTLTIQQISNFLTLNICSRVWIEISDIAILKYVFLFST